jgi:predicted RNA-binding protein with PIN domain
MVNTYIQLLNQNVEIVFKAHCLNGIQLNYDNATVNSWWPSELDTAER